MPIGIKIANSGINALTNTNPKNFSLYVDGSEDHILVKEKSRGTDSVNAFTTKTINHDLGAFPFTMVQVEISSGEFEWVYGTSAYNLYYAYVTTAQLLMRNGEASSKNFTHIIFYDEL